MNLTGGRGVSGSTNPWVMRDEPAPMPAPPIERPHPSGPARPQPGAVAPPEQALPTLPLGPLPAGSAPAWWWLGCHGGAGVTTLARGVAGGADSARRWPAPEDPTGRVRVLLVARTHASGLRAAQEAARQWAAGAAPAGVDLLGLVLVADAPGRLPRPLRELRRLVAGGLPHVWDVPYVEALRVGEPDPSPSTFARLARDLHQLIGGT